MSFFDNDPPKHLDIGSITRGKNFNIQTSENGKRFKYCVCFTLEEKKVLLENEDIFFQDILTNSNKKYKEALEIKARAEQYIKNKKKKEDEFTK